MDLTPTPTPHPTPPQVVKIVPKFIASPKNNLWKICRQPEKVENHRWKVHNSFVFIVFILKFQQVQTVIILVRQNPVLWEDVRVSQGLFS